MLGVSALHLESGERIRLRSSERFPMASTFKVAVAIKVLDLVDRGALSLSREVDVDGDNVSPGSGELKETGAGVRKPLTVARLLDYMLRDSDNTATDLLLAMAGGPDAVTAQMRGLGLADFDVSRPAAELVADSWGYALPPAGQRNQRTLAQQQKSVAVASRARAAARFLQDPRDTTTPDAMVFLLQQLHRGKALSPASTELLLDHMANCRTGTRRLRGELPRGTPVAHKTGTLSRVATNDVGIVTLPWRGGHVVVAIFLKGSGEPLKQQEQSIAMASRRIYDHYTR